MRTNIIIDDELMASAMAAGAFTTKKEAVEEGLRLLARRATYDRILALRGKVKWSLAGDWTQDSSAGSVFVAAEAQPEKKQLRVRAPKRALVHAA